jgi:peptide/nickel transport system substrate-binding protein
VRDFERHALTEAYTVPLLWWNRIVATSASLKGWSITPSHFIGQDLTDVWLNRKGYEPANAAPSGRVGGSR